MQQDLEAKRLRNKAMARTIKGFNQENILLKT